MKLVKELLFIALLLAVIVPAGGFAHNRIGTHKAVSAPNDTSSQDSCFYLYVTGTSEIQSRYYQEGYDTLKLYIERCPNSYQSWRAFGDLNVAIQNLENGNPMHDSELWADYRHWIESVLYFNTTDPEYFCQCVQQIIFYPADTSQQQFFKSTNTAVALEKWIVQNTTCDTPDVMYGWLYIRKQQRQRWINDSIGGLHYPNDTTIPPFSSLDGLDTLLAKHFLYASIEKPMPTILSNASASPNPVNNGTIISFGISKEAYVKIELFDVLGHELSQPGFESLFEPGNKSVPISLAGLPSGTYYARIITAYGEVQTVKLVKE